MKDIVWTDNLVSRFWDYMSTKNKADNDYFAFALKDALINFMAFYSKFENKKFLDFGCGKGFLFDDLLAKNAKCYGIDFSEDSLKSAEEKYGNNVNFGGTQLIRDNKINFPDNTFDIISCIEVIEHVLDNYLDNTFDELFRVLKPNGIILFTTPNNEDLEKGMIYCPESNLRHHCWQHVRSWSVESLSKKLKSHKFDLIFVEGINLIGFQQKPFVSKKSVLDMSIRNIYHEIEYFFYKKLLSNKHYRSYILKRHNFKNNLVAVVTKKS